MSTVDMPNPRFRWRQGRNAMSRRGLANLYDRQAERIASLRKQVELLSDILRQRGVHEDLPPPPPGPKINERRRWRGKGNMVVGGTIQHNLNVETLGLTAQAQALLAMLDRYGINIEHPELDALCVVPIPGDPN
jgi:hypothetical protein